MSSTNIVNPTNAPPSLHQALPFRTISAKAKKPRDIVDRFNTGGDYLDEEAPLLTVEESSFSIEEYKRRIKPALAVIPGLIDPPTQAEVTALGKIDESAQGTHIKYLREAVVVDIDAKLITSTMNEMKQGKFREAHFPTIAEYMHSNHYRRLRESSLVMRNVVSLAKKTVLGAEESATPIGIRLDPRLVRTFRQVDVALLNRLKESKDFKHLKESKGIKESGISFDSGQDRFALDDAAANAGVVTDVSGVGREMDFLPLMSGPYSKQLYWFDYLDMHSKAFEAWTHNPIAKRICKIIPQFVLGKGVEATVISAELATGKTVPDEQTGEKMDEVLDYREQAQGILDEHWRRNSMVIRSKQILRDLVIFGEQFPRYFEAPWGLKVRQIDPSTVWEVVTDPDDCENIFYLHQQYPTRYQWFVDLPIPTIKYIIRQVPSLHFYHMKINTVAGEVRGRSEIFAVLGWLKRVKEFATDRVIRNKMANLFVLDVSVEGGETEVTTARAQFSTPPTPGSFFIHNKAAELQGIRAEVGAGDVTADWDMLMVITAVGAGISQEYLGLPSSGTKAGALVGTEPDIKTFEDYQDIMECFFQQDCERVFQRAKEMKKLPDKLEVKVEITYPAIAEENRSEKLKDIAFEESMSHISHRRASTMAARELSITSYEYEEEQKQIAEEDAQKELMVNAAYAQILKGQQAPEKGADGGGADKGMLPQGGGTSLAPDAGGSPKGDVRGGTSVPSSTSGRKTAYPFDPRDVASGIKREAATLISRKPGLHHKRDAMLTPDRVRDQKSMDRGDIVTKGRRAVHGHYNESEDRQVRESRKGKKKPKR